MLTKPACTCVVLVGENVSTRGVWWLQVETGNPYMLYKDTCNRKSNQQNLGTIKCSNLCTEIMEFTSPEETAVCNLASIALPRFVRERNSDGRRIKLVGSLDASNRCNPPACATALHCADVMFDVPGLDQQSWCRIHIQLMTWDGLLTWKWAAGCLTLRSCGR